MGRLKRLAMIKLKLKDDQYPFKGIDHIRKVVRCILLDENNNVCLEHILDDDGFGPRNYYETPGGGVKEGEDLSTALKREIEEEVGYHIEIIKQLGEVDDYYNLIKRKNINYFFLARRTSKCPSHQEEDELRRIDNIIWVDIDKAIELYVNMQNVLVGRLVKQRELPILRLAKCALQEHFK